MMLEILGFTTLESTLWNSVAYVSLIAIVFGITYERFRAPILVFAPFMLALYSGFFLKDQLFTIAQLLITVSGLLGMFRVGRPASAITILCLVALTSVSLLILGVFEDKMAIVGYYGLLGIVFGIMFLPEARGFLILTVGTLLLIAYSYSVGAWVFFTLNFILLFANMRGFVKALGEIKTIQDKTQ